MKTACILLAEGFEEVEAITPADYLRRAGIDVTIAGITGKRVRGCHGIIIETDSGQEALDKDYDAILIPGGMPGARNLAENALVRGLIIRHYKKGKIIAAICASPALVLHAACNLLEGKKFTGYPGTEDQIKGGHFFPERVVVDGNIITSQGPGTAGEFAISIISLLEGPQKANEVAQHTLLK
ncbi:MAG TPA: DJ-1/PfpI family protein [Rectinema sp.]|nr:DJ-1/PfpI family protein [Rectinema sp.]